MFFELRKYRLKKGCGNKFINLMDEMILPFQKEMGMEITGSFRVKDDDDLFIWIRRFDNESSRAKLYDKVYSSKYWCDTIRPAMGDMLIREDTQVYILEPTISSNLS